MKKIVGRFKEIAALQRHVKSDTSEFVVVYGRRRVGKTFLIRETFNYNFHFYLTGMANATTEEQLRNFTTTLQKHQKKTIKVAPTNWYDAFQLLIQYIDKIKVKNKIIFIDELPWLDTPKSDFMSALEHFWNHWASARNDIKLIACGSAASWILNRLINNTGGLYNRVTQKIKLLPFTLHETELYLKSKHIDWNRYQIIEIYMALGGIPFYLNEIQKGYSATQVIDYLFFSDKAVLRDEFDKLYASLFRFANNHIAMVEVLSRKTIGLTRTEILAGSKLSNGGGNSKVLEELEQSGFIRKYVPIGKKVKDSLYQITDFYTLFYFNFIKNKKIDKDNYWSLTAGTARHNTWKGYSFEQVCMLHLPQLKMALGIAGVQTDAASWRSKNADNNAQIDLLIDRNDQVINICEMKFSLGEFTIDKNYAEALRNKLQIFKTQTKTKKAVFLTMVTTYGITPNANATQLVANSITIDALFKELYN